MSAAKANLLAKKSKSGKRKRTIANNKELFKKMTRLYQQKESYQKVADGFSVMKQCRYPIKLETEEDKEQLLHAYQYKRYFRGLRKDP